MSYNPVQNEDSLSELISKQNDARQICENLLKSKNDINAFTIWLDKACLASKRDAMIFVRKHFNEFNDPIRRYVANFVKEKPSKEEFY